MNFLLKPAIHPAPPQATNHVAPSCRYSAHYAIDRAYRELDEDTAQQDVLRHLCQGLAEALDSPLVALVHRSAGGTLAAEATSRENLLWAEFRRLPERWDGTITGDGPAARALHRGEAVSIFISDEGFLPWREAAKREGISQIEARPLHTADQAWVLLVCASNPNAFSIDPQSVGIAAKGCARLLDASARRARERLLSSALHHSGSPAFIADIEGQIVWCNASFSRLSGYSSDQVIGQNPRLLSSGRYGRRHYRALWNTIRTGHIYRGETVDHDIDGNAFIAMQTITPFGSGDRVTHYLAIYDDISQQKDEQEQRALRAGLDPLTGLMHEAALEHAMCEDLEQGTQLRIAVVAAHGTSAVEALGSEVSDLVDSVLRTRIRDVVGAGSVARKSCCEYLIWLAADVDQADRQVECLQTELLEPYPLKGDVSALDLRMGVAVSPRDGATLNELLRATDRALGMEPYEPARRALRSNPD